MAKFYERRHVHRNPDIDEIVDLADDIDSDSDKSCSDDTEEKIQKSMEDELPEVFPPYLPPMKIDTKPYCLVLDLDETLIHFVDEREAKGDDEGDVYYMVRPGCSKFLSTLARYWEIVVYTAAM